MSGEKARPTVEELFETLKRTSLPTVLVEGIDDIIFYRKVEEDLKEFDVDMLPAGNKGAVLDLHKKLMENPVSAPMIFIVDNDLWVHAPPEDIQDLQRLVLTTGYSVENDLFIDGELENLLTEGELSKFKKELYDFTRWYALAVHRHLNGEPSTFRTHPNHILDDQTTYTEQTTLKEGEIYPLDLFNEIFKSYGKLLRGKSLFALLIRELSAKKRNPKFGSKQLMAIGAARKGDNFKRIKSEIKQHLEQITNAQQHAK